MQSRNSLEESQKHQLNKYQSALLNKIPEMTEEMLLSWRPHNPEESKHLQGEFTEQHAKAVLFFYRNKMSAEHAIAEVSGLNEGEARCLRLFHHKGITAEILRKIDTDSCVVDSHAFHRALSLLLKHDKSADDAFVELDHLEPHHLLVLHDFYQNGLRADDIRAVVQTDVKNEFKYGMAFDNYANSKKFRDYFKTLLVERIQKLDDVRQALNTTLADCDRKLEDSKSFFFGIKINPTITFLDRHRQQGLVPADLPQSFSSAHQKLFTAVLRKEPDAKKAMRKVTFFSQQDKKPAEVIKELSTMTADQVKELGEEQNSPDSPKM